MKNNQTEPTVSELEGTLSDRVGNTKSRRLRSILTYMAIFFACVLISTCVWLIVHYVRSVPSGEATGNVLALTGSVGKRFL